MSLSCIIKNIINVTFKRIKKGSERNIHERAIVEKAPKRVLNERRRFMTKVGPLNSRKGQYPSAEETREVLGWRRDK